MKRIPVSAGGGRADYEVLLEAGLRHRVVDLLRDVAPAVRRWAVISDDRVAPLHGEPVSAALAAAGLDGTLLTFPAGEENKRRREWGRLTDALLEAGFGRDAGIVAVGGGVTGDLAGFVAATYLRGVPVVQMPTSTLAMIDASVGGKTGVDTGFGKNLVGAFHPPALVLADPETIATLPDPERAQGLVEALKHGAILDRSHAEDVLARADALRAADVDALVDVVGRSIEIKADVVSRDEREGGLREVLNFGHTVGHALELLAGFSLPHGTAVGRGMVLEARLGERWGVTEEGTAAWIESGVRALGIDPAVADLDAAAVADACARDKKARALPRIVLLARAGEVATVDGGWAHARSVDEIRATLTALAG